MSGPFLPTMGSILGLPAPAAQTNPRSFIVLGLPLSTAEIAEWTNPDTKHTGWHCPNPHNH